MFLFLDSSKLVSDFLFCLFFDVIQPLLNYENKQFFIDEIKDEAIFQQSILRTILVIADKETKEMIKLQFDHMFVEHEIELKMKFGYRMIKDSFDKLKEDE